MTDEIQLTERALLPKVNTKREAPIIVAPKKSKTPCCMIRMNNNNKTFWDLCIIVAAIWNCICIPL